jgi:hypothetical protein
LVGVQLKLKLWLEIVAQFQGVHVAVANPLVLSKLISSLQNGVPTGGGVHTVIDHGQSREKLLNGAGNHP